MRFSAGVSLVMFSWFLFIKLRQLSSFLVQITQIHRDFNPSSSSTNEMCTDYKTTQGRSLAFQFKNFFSFVLGLKSLAALMKQSMWAYLMVYSSVPSSVIRSSLFGMVMLWATDFLPLWKKVSGVQILLAIRLLRRSTAMGPLNFNLSSFQLCLKKTSIVYSYRWSVKGRERQESIKNKGQKRGHNQLAVFWQFNNAGGGWCWVIQPYFFLFTLFLIFSFLHFSLPRVTLTFSH